MPYITQADRRILGAEDFIMAIPLMLASGQLNYILTLIVHRYLEDNGGNYQAMNDILGALDGCAKEFYRRKVAPYEDKKIEENGDV